MYDLLLDGIELSLKVLYKFIDEEGRTFIYFTHGTIRERLNSGNDKAAAIFQELESCNLIE